VSDPDHGGFAAPNSFDEARPDLHDLLEHSLSLIVVKAEVVRRMASRDAGRVIAEATEIETIGRRALEEVREAVTGYRESGLDPELGRARHSLLEAGIEPTIDLSEALLTAEADALLGWVVREGVTNVLRHSRARHCRIEVDGQDGHASLRVEDDGVGGTAPPGKRPGPLA
jgi:two-component system sensor histidine kinase DesK